MKKLKIVIQRKGLCTTATTNRVADPELNAGTLAHVATSLVTSRQVLYNLVSALSLLTLKCYVLTWQCQHVSLTLKVTSLASSQAPSMSHAGYTDAETPNI